MKHLVALFLSSVLGAVIAAFIALIAFPNVSSSYAPPIIVFPIFSVWISGPAYIIAMVVNSCRTKDPNKKKEPNWGITVSAIATLIAAIAVAALVWFKEMHR